MKVYKPSLIVLIVLIVMYLSSGVINICNADAILFPIPRIKDITGIDIDITGSLSPKESILIGMIVILAVLLSFMILFRIRNKKQQPPEIQ